MAAKQIYVKSLQHRHTDNCLHWPFSHLLCGFAGDTFLSCSTDIWVNILSASPTYRDCTHPLYHTEHWQLQRVCTQQLRWLPFGWVAIRKGQSTATQADTDSTYWGVLWLPDICIHLWGRPLVINHTVHHQRGGTEGLGYVVICFFFQRGADYKEYTAHLWSKQIWSRVPFLV